jgi:hypothetical protein
MATTNTLTDSSPTPALAGGGLLVVLPALHHEQYQSLFANLVASMPAEELLIAAPEGIQTDQYPALRFVSLPSTRSAWTLTAADFTSAYQIAEKNHARAILMLGPECDSLDPSGLRELAHAVVAASVDLAVSYYDLPPRAGLVNSSILYPLSRALFATRVRFPLAIDLGLSLRMAEQLAAAATRLVANNQGDAPIWPGGEAALAGMTIEEVDVGGRRFPQPAEMDLNTILPLVTGSLFSDIESKAALWQRARTTPPSRRRIPANVVSPSDANAEIASMIQGFRLGYTNLLEIWGLVLPPNSLLGLKRLSQLDGAAFKMPEQLWAHIVFDFLVAYRLRSINRGHLLGALIPLYLAWVAGHINVVASGVNPERHVEAVAAAFEADKPYLVARWRWPDRFNP